MDVLARTIAEFPDTRANGMHDLHTAVLMREHGISRICTLDSGFRRFPFLTVVDPSGLSESRVRAIRVDSGTSPQSRRNALQDLRVP